MPARFPTGSSRFSDGRDSIAVASRPSETAPDRKGGRNGAAHGPHCPHGARTAADGTAAVCRRNIIKCSTIVY